MTRDDIVKITTFLTDLKNYPGFAEVPETSVRRRLQPHRIKHLTDQPQGVALVCLSANRAFGSNGPGRTDRG